MQQKQPAVQQQSWMAVGSEPGCQVAVDVFLRLETTKMDCFVFFAVKSTNIISDVYVIFLRIAKGLNPRAEPRA